MHPMHPHFHHHHCDCECHKPQYIVLFSGDDSDFVGNQTIFIELETEIDTTGCKAHLKYIGKTFTWDEIPEDKRLELVFSAEETKAMPLGDWDAELWLEDAQGRRRTVSNRIRIRVTKSVEDAYRSEDPQSIKTNIGNEFNYNNAYNKPTLNGVVIEGNKTSRDYHIEGGGGGGTDDYNELYNKPKINGVELGGDKSSSDLGLQDKLPVDPYSGVYSISTYFAQEANRANVAETAQSAQLAEFAQKAGDDGQGRDIADTYATKEDTYNKSEVDDKITRFVAHYLTTKINNRFVPFPTHAALAEARRTHTEANPKFFYAGTGFTPTKNDYCAILADETYDGKTTRYSFVGDWPTGSFQYQYTINDTTFSQAQWDAINSGITSDLIDQTVEAINGKQDKLPEEDGTYQIRVTSAAEADEAGHALNAENASIADTANADADGNPITTTYVKTLYDTVVGKIDEERHDDNIMAKTIRVPIEFARTPFNAVKVSFHEVSYEEGDEMYIGVGYSSGTGGSSGVNYTDTILSFSRRHFSDIVPGPHVYVFEEDFLDRIPQDAKFLTFFFSTSFDIEDPDLSAAPIETGYATDEEVAQKKYQIQETDGFFHLEHAPLMEFLVVDDPVARKSSVDAVGTKVDEIKETVSTDNRFLVDDTTAAIQTRESEDAEWSDEIRLDKGYDALQGTAMVKLDKSVQTVTVDGGTLEVIFPDPVDGTVRDLCLYVNNTDSTTECEMTFPDGTYYGADGWDAAAQKGGITGYYFSEIPGNGWRVSREELKQFSKGA